MILIFNIPGIIILIVSAVLLNIYSRDYYPLLFSNATYFYFALGLLFLIFDIPLRAYARKKASLGSKAYGGKLFFVPVYIWGIICVLISAFFFIHGDFNGNAISDTYYCQVQHDCEIKHSNGIIAPSNSSCPQFWDWSCEKNKCVWLCR